MRGKAEDTEAAYESTRGFGAIRKGTTDSGSWMLTVGSHGHRTSRSDAITIGRYNAAISPAQGMVRGRGRNPDDLCSKFGVLKLSAER